MVTVFLVSSQENAQGKHIQSFQRQDWEVGIYLPLTFYQPEISHIVLSSYEGPRVCNPVKVRF